MASARASRLAYFKAVNGAKNPHWANILKRVDPRSIWSIKKTAMGSPPKRFPSLPGASTPDELRDALLQHFFPLSGLPQPPPLATIEDSPDFLPFSPEEVAQALANSSSLLVPGPDTISYYVWKQVHRLVSTLIPFLLNPLASFAHHPPCLKKANGIVLDKPGKPSYDTPASFRIIILLKTISQICKRLMAVRLSPVACELGLLHPNQCGSHHGLSTFDPVSTLHQEV